MRGSGKFCQRGVQLWQVMLCCWWGEGGSKYHYERAIIAPPAKRHLNGVSLACQWWPNVDCWLGSFVIFQGIRTSIVKKPCFCEFSGGGVLTPVPSGSAHEQQQLHWVFEACIETHIQYSKLQLFIHSMIDCKGFISLTENWSQT